MAAVLGTNVASLWASKNLQSAQSDMANSVERLSSGLRINRARDDAAGLGLSNALTQQINSSQQGIRNINDGISMVQTAEGALAQASEMAQRILALAVQATNGSLNTTQKTSINSEMKELIKGINNIEARTKFSGITLLGATATISIYNGQGSTDKIDIATTALAKISDTGAGGTFTLSGWIATAAGSSSDTAANYQNIATSATAFITSLDTQRGLLGAVQNQMEYSVNNITELSANLTSARSRIIDTDYASETANLTKGQILQQAATAMLAQANQMPNVILSLLK
jgi:flagellin